MSLRMLKNLGTPCGFFENALDSRSSVSENAQEYWRALVDFFENALVSSLRMPKNHGRP